MNIISPVTPLKSAADVFRTAYKERRKP